MKKLRKRLAKLPKALILGLLILSLALLAGFIGYKKGFLSKQFITSITQPQEEVTPEKIKVLQAKVTLESEEQTVEILAGHERELKDGDKITTDASGIATLIYPSETVARIGPSSQITFEDSNTLFQEVGKIYVRFKKLLGVQEEFEVESASGVAAVRGTAFASIIRLNRDPRILVADHEIEVIPKDTAGKRLEDLKKIVKKGEQAEISRLRRTVAVALQKLTEDEKEWLEFNLQSDEDLTREDIFKLFKTLSALRSSPTATSSATPLATAVPLSSFTSMPGHGYNKGSVVTSVGTFPLACYGANKGSIRMITDSASDSDCRDDCPVLPLDVYATRNGGVAAINGMYFCPADYPSCVDKSNSFDTLFFNSRTKTYMNSANNIYSNIPFVGMNADHSVVFVGTSSSWGRDTSIIGGTAGNPMLMQGSNYAVNEGALDDKQRSVKSNRGAIVLEGEMLYLCITGSATVPDSAKVYQTLGADYAINIDGGGSSALWVQGSYKYGPGRQIPTAIILAP